MLFNKKALIIILPCIHMVNLFGQAKFSAGVYLVPAYMEHRHDDYTSEGIDASGKNSSAILNDGFWRIRYFSRPLTYSLGTRFRFEPNRNFMIQSGFYFRNLISNAIDFPPHINIPLIARYSPISSDNAVNPFIEFGAEYVLTGNPIPATYGISDISDFQLFTNIGVAIYLSDEWVLDVAPGYRHYVTGKDPARFRYYSFQLEIGINYIYKVLDGYYDSNGRRHRKRLDCPTVESIW